MTSVRSTLPLLLLLATLLAPPAAAAWFGPSTIHPAPYRLGDVLESRWSNLFVDDGRTRTHSGSVVTAFEGLGTAADKYGIERPTVDVRSDAWLDGEPFGSQTCRLLREGNATVRNEVHWGSNGYGGSWQGSGGLSISGVSSARYTLETTPKAYFWGTCGLHLVTRTAVAEGDRVPIREAFGGDWRGIAEPALSDPAVATTFHGRDAVRLTWRLEDLRDDGGRGTLWAILADGLPGIVAGGNEGTTADGRPFRYEHELVGFAAGEGGDAPLLGGAALPERDPAARFARMRALSADDEAFRLPYPFAEALRDARTLLPQFDAFLDARPDAVLANAYYDRRCQTTPRLPSVGPADTDGCWWLTVGEGSADRTAFVTRRATPDGLPTTPAQAYAMDQGSSGGAARLPTRAMLPEEGIDPQTLARVAAREGVRVGTVETFWVGTWAGTDRAYRYYAVGDVSTNSAEDQEGTREGLNVNVDAQTGGATNVYAVGKTTERSGLLEPPAGGGLDGTPAAALSALAGPGVGVGLGVGAATGLALLVVAIKFLLVPLFTRLVRARLLDNPVRSRLYERIRAEPGIRQAELVDYLGVGEGAARHHLAQLVRHRYVVETREGGAASYYAAGEVPPEVARRAAVLRSGSAKRVYDAFAASPDLTLREAAALLDMSAPSVHRQKRRLEEAGLLPAARATVSASP